ncbi:MAG: helix-turn-helix transcriptional regulator [Deltaproteobacteria bacterium]|jgi:transcriptional regulator with XRE-family HTH domain|nr:helix-turn-helix transcriptional regulator [Deltaproteobacteria bacterium]
MKNRYKDRAFALAFKSEIQKLGFGGQTKVAKKSGVSKSMINDILNGRTFGSLETQQALVKALGYEDFKIFLELVPQPPEESQLTPLSSSEVDHRSNDKDTLLEVLLENRALRQELERARQELQKFRRNYGQIDNCLPSPPPNDP